MASAPANDTLEANDVESIVSIRVTDIELGDRLRPVDPVWSAALGAIMAREGQRTPIEVCRLPGRSHWTLVTGGHRLEGARAEGIEYLKAIIVGSDRADRRMREVSENLWRKALDPMDRAAFIAEIHSLLRAKCGVDIDASAQQIAANARWQKALALDAADASATIADAYGLDAKVGEQLGLSERTVRNDLLLHRRISPSLIEQLRADRHPVANNATQLRALAKIDPREQAEAVEYLTWRTHTNGVGPVKSVAEAVALVRDKTRLVSSPEDKRLSTFVGTFQRMGLSERHGALQQLPLPAGTSFWHGQHRADMLAALNTGFAVLTGLLDGEPTDDDALLDAAGKLQQMLHTIQGVA